MQTPHDSRNELHPITLDVRSLCQGLRQRATLAPSPVVNRLFGGLVGLAQSKTPQATAIKVLAELKADGTLPKLHQLCAKGEFELEAHWGEKIRESDTPMETLREFPYWNNYKKLVKMEMAALRAAHPGFKKVLFVGAGPLPLSSFIMGKHYGVDVHHLEVEEGAHCCAMDWMEKILGVGHIPCHHMDVMDFSDFAQYDVVVLAALVGVDHETKARILSHLQHYMNPAQTLMIRSVKGMRGLLYPEVLAGDLPGFQVVKEVHPRGEVVNSVILARKLAEA